AAGPAQVPPAGGLDPREAVADDLARSLGDEHQAVGLPDLRDEEASVADLRGGREQEPPRVGRVVLAHEGGAVAAEGVLVGRRRGSDRNPGGPSGVRPAVHLIEHPVLGSWSAAGARPSTMASSAARRSWPVTRAADLGRLSSSRPREGGRGGGAK